MLQFDEENYPSENDVDFNDDGKNEYLHGNEQSMIKLLQNEKEHTMKESSQSETNVPKNFVFTINLNHIPGDSHSTSHTIASNAQK